MSQTPDGDVIHFQDLIRLLDFSVLFRWSTWLHIHDKNTVGRCPFTARDTQTWKGITGQASFKLDYRWQ